MTSSGSQVRVVNLGLGRTGTISFQDAMNTLGFGPCHHMTTILFQKPESIPIWTKVHGGEDPVRNLRKAMEEYQSGTDYPIALYPELCLEAFPNAKFVLTVRSSSSWKASVTDTIYRVQRITWFPSWFNPKGWRFWVFSQEVIWGPNGQFEGNFESNGEQKFIEHNERVKRVIPSDKLLVMEVGEGWERLCKFLDVPVPEVPYPRTNPRLGFIAKTKQMFPLGARPFFYTGLLLTIMGDWISSFASHLKL
ncbi:hypothetical protein DL96DRAFT_1588732, partial [Flagelloscypha sp. PMI_526]